jgi:hypothetical protein
MSDKKWHDDATYAYSTYMGSDPFTSLVTFTFPNAASGELQFTDWLYRYKDGEKYATNITAEMLMCYVDDLLRNKVSG